MGEGPDSRARHRHSSVCAELPGHQRSARVRPRRNPVPSPKLQQPHWAPQLTREPHRVPLRRWAPRKPRKNLGICQEGTWQYQKLLEPFFLSLSGEIFHPLHPTPQLPNPWPLPFRKVELLSPFTPVPDGEGVQSCIICKVGGRRIQEGIQHVSKMESSAK